jgi:hypothetical protein
MSTPDETPVATNQAETLAIAYAAERQDDQGALTLAFTMATAFFTYVIAATTFVFSKCDRNGCGTLWWVPLVTPIIPIALGGHMTLLTAATRIRSVHLQRLEAALKTRLTIDGRTSTHYEPQFHTDAGIVWRPDQLGAEPRLGLLFALITLVVYGIVFLTIPAFTSIMMFIGPRTNWTKALWVLYGAVEFVVILGLLIPLRHPRFRYQGS